METNIAETINKVKVIIADDHRIARNGLQNYLALDPQIELVGIAENGLEAVDLTRQYQPDVVIMDLSMPVMDGFEATSLIKQAMPQIRIIVFSNSAEVNVQLKAQQAGADCFLRKVLDVDKLFPAIKSIRLDFFPFLSF